MSPRRSSAPFTATGTSAMASTPVKAPVTRKLMRSERVSTAPPATTAFSPRHAVEQLLRGDAEIGEAGVGELDVDLLRPLADESTFSTLGIAEQALADEFRLPLQLAGAAPCPLRM